MSRHNQAEFNWGVVIALGVCIGFWLCAILIVAEWML